jgi:hypothetical protein
LRLGLMTLMRNLRTSSFRAFCLELTFLIRSDEGGRLGEVSLDTHMSTGIVKLQERNWALALRRSEI